jgi:hypothetical protein
VPAAAGQLGQVGDLGVHHAGVPQLLAQHGLADDHVQPRGALVQGDPLAGEHSGGGRRLPLLGHAGVRGGCRAGVGRDLQQLWDLDRGVGDDRGRGGLGGHELQVRIAEHAGVLGPPSGSVAAGTGQCHEGFLHGGVGPVLGQQLTQFLSADAALAGLDPADLRRVALQGAGRVAEVVACAFPVLAQAGADQALPGRCRGCGHRESPSSS